MNEIIIIAEEFWRNSHLSLARHYGQIKFNGANYIIVNKHGITILELSHPKSPHYVPGEKAIPLGEPCDLVREDWLPVYKMLGRKRTMEIVEKGMSLKEAKKINR